MPGGARASRPRGVGPLGDRASRRAPRCRRARERPGRRPGPGGRQAVRHGAVALLRARADVVAVRPFDSLARGDATPSSGRGPRAFFSGSSLGLGGRARGARPRAAGRAGDGLESSAETHGPAVVLRARARVDQSQPSANSNTCLTSLNDSYPDVSTTGRPGRRFPVLPERVRTLAAIEARDDRTRGPDATSSLPSSPRAASAGCRRAAGARGRRRRSSRRSPRP